jgi:hypothetical protein
MRKPDPTMVRAGRNFNQAIKDAARLRAGKSGNSAEFIRD